jgi:hypothetical protein
MSDAVLHAFVALSLTASAPPDGAVEQTRKPQIVKMIERWSHPHMKFL